jgi:hypothetical protein
MNFPIRFFEQGGAEASSVIEQRLDQTLGGVFRERGQLGEQQYIKTKIALYSELYARTRSSVFQTLLDKTISENISVLKHQ